MYRRQVSFCDHARAPSCYRGVPPRAACCPILRMWAARRRGRQGRATMRASSGRRRRRRRAAPSLACILRTACLPTRRRHPHFFAPAFIVLRRSPVRTWPAPCLPIFNTTSAFPVLLFSSRSPTVQPTLPSWRFFFCRPMEEEGGTFPTCLPSGRHAHVFWISGGRRRRRRTAFLRRGQSHEQAASARVIIATRAAAAKKNPPSPRRRQATTRRARAAGGGAHVGLGALGAGYMKAEGASSAACCCHDLCRFRPPLPKRRFSILAEGQHTLQAATARCRRGALAPAAGAVRPRSSVSVARGCAAPRLARRGSVVAAAGALYVM